MSTEQREVPLDQGAIEHKDAGEMKQGGKWGATLTSAAAAYCRHLARAALGCAAGPSHH